jgi:hypothetical protein
MSHSCCRERTLRPSQIVSICLHNRQPQLLTKHSPRSLRSRQGAHQQCRRDCRQAVASCVQDAVLQVQQHVESPDAGRCTSSTARARSTANADQSQVEGLLFWGWLGGHKYEGGNVKCGQLLTIEDLGAILHSMYRKVTIPCFPNSMQSPSISRIAMSSISHSKSICSRSSRSSRNWYVTTPRSSTTLLTRL